MRTLAIHLGSRRVGLALSDESGRLATPLDVLDVISTGAAIAPILYLIQEHDVERLVVGLPMNMDDSIGPAARQTIQWARRLAKESDLPVILVDERLSSYEADQQLADLRRQGQRLTHAGKKRRRDALAATAFLQAFLDGHLPAFDPPGDHTGY
jgi:putative holliday junction resolvase